VGRNCGFSLPPAHSTSAITLLSSSLVFDGRTWEGRQVDTGIPQGSPVAPILFVTYPSGIFDEVEAAVPGILGLSFVDDISWWVEGMNDEEVAAKLSVRIMGVRR